ncbi:hypothetical protein Dimus_033805 [Dionaea muscipula]
MQKSFKGVEGISQVSAQPLRHKIKDVIFDIGREYNCRDDKEDVDTGHVYCENHKDVGDEDEEDKDRDSDEEEEEVDEEEKKEALEEAGIEERTKTLSPTNGEPPVAATMTSGNEYFVMVVDMRMFDGDEEELAENDQVVMMNVVSDSAEGDTIQVPELADDVVRDAPNEELDVNGELIAYAG